MTNIIKWTPYGAAEYEMSWRIRPKHLSDPKRFEHFPRRDRHCNDTSQFMRLSRQNNRIAGKLLQQGASGMEAIDFTTLNAAFDAMRSKHEV